MSRGGDVGSRPPGVAGEGGASHGNSHDEGAVVVVAQLDGYGIALAGLLRNQGDDELGLVAAGYAFGGVPPFGLDRPSRLLRHGPILADWQRNVKILMDVPAAGVRKAG